MTGTGDAWARTITRWLAIVATVGLILSLGVTGAFAQEAPPEADNTVTHIQIQSDGDAVWTVQVRTRLDSDQRVADFQAYQAGFEENESRYLDPFRTRIRAVVNRATNRTGRSMTATNFTAETTVQEVPRRWGVVTFEFEWVAFADSQDGTIVVGDVFEGGWFLAANDSLEVTAPDGWVVTAIEPTPDERDEWTVTWHGREDFSDGHPRIVYRDEDTIGTGEPTTVRTSATPMQPRAADGEYGLLIGGLLLVGILVTGTYLWREHAAGRPEGAAGSDTENVDDTDIAPAESTGVIMTDAERVQELLESRGGRLKQSAIAEELGWSASKASRVISAMVEDGTVEKLQLGRENLVDLAEDDRVQ